MSALPDLSGIITLTIARTRVTRYPVVACYTVLLYEFFLVLDQEYRLIYKSRWTLLKCLYLACRFIPLVLWPVNMFNFMEDHDRQECTFLVIFSTLSFIPLLALPQCIYVFRVWSITGRRVSLLWILLVCLGTYLGIVLWSTTDDFTVSDAAFTLLPKTGCYRPTYHGYSTFVRPILAAIALNSIVGGILATHYWLVRRAKGPLGRLILKQDILFHPIMLLLNTFTAVILTRPVRYLDRTAMVIVIIMSNITACRFILQIRELTQPTELSELEQLSLQVRKDLRRVQTNLVETKDTPASNSSHPTTSLC